MHYHELGYAFEQHGGSGRSHALLNGPDEALNFRNMFLFECTFRFMPRAVIYLRSGSNSQSVCLCVILKTRCRYNLCTCVIPSAMCSTFLFLIILPVADMMSRDMVLRNPILLMCMRSQHMVTSLYLSMMILETLVILTGSTCCILRRNVLPFRCGMLGPCIYPHPF